MSTLKVNAITDASGGNTATINTYTPTESNMGGKNRIINGAMSFWQRGTSFTNPAVSGNFYTADRWGVNRAGDVTGATVSQSTDVPSGFEYSLKLQRTAGNTSTAGLYLFNSNETANTRDLAGQSVTFSFWVKRGANYSGGTLSVQGYWGTGTDQRVYAYTGATAFINTTQAITSTWTRYSFTGTVGASSTEVGFRCFWTPAGTAGADDSIYITGVQLEVGPVATPFERRPYGTELALCQRYYWKITGSTNVPFGSGFNSSTTQNEIVTFFPVEMRTAPTALEQSGTASHYRVRHANTDTTCSAVPTFQNASNWLAWSASIVASGLTAGQGSFLRSNNASAYLAWSAEL
jgi:hypothetical protein